MINARAETIFDKPAFRSTIRKRRCLIPADGFYEWANVGKVKQPYFIRMKNETLFAMAGIWEHCKNQEGEELLSCAIVTTAANELMKPFHHRMPVIISTQEFDSWLNPAVNDRDLLEPLLVSYPADKMTAYPVSREVNSPHMDRPECNDQMELDINERFRQE